MCGASYIGTMLLGQQHLGFDRPVGCRGLEVGSSTELHGPIPTFLPWTVVWHMTPGYPLWGVLVLKIYTVGCCAADLGS